MLAQRGADQEAFCAVCGDGQSVPPNLIVLCDRCDVAVHQLCYGTGPLPAGDWLCEPCREFEEAQRAQGVPQVRLALSARAFWEGEGVWTVESV